MSHVMNGLHLIKGMVFLLIGATCVGVLAFLLTALAPQRDRAEQPPSGAIFVTPAAPSPPILRRA